MNQQVGIKLSTSVVQSFQCIPIPKYAKSILPNQIIKKWTSVNIISHSVIYHLQVFSLPHNPPPLLRANFKISSISITKFMVLLAAFIINYLTTQERSNHWWCSSEINLVTCRTSWFFYSIHFRNDGYGMQG